jgi:hypothetical protein
LAHEYCYFLHDQCARILVEYEKERAQSVSFTFKNEEERGIFEKAANESDSISALRLVGRHDEARRVVINTVTMALVSDCLHHLFEALRCMERRKFVVSLNLLRKPLLDSLVFLSWILGDEDSFYEAFTKQSPAALSPSSVGNRRTELIRLAHRKTALNDLVSSTDIVEILFNKRNLQGIHWVLQRAVHLITVQYIEFETEPENFNFIFKKHTDDDVYVGLYKHLPTTLLYLSHVIINLFDRMKAMDGGAKLAFNIRTTWGHHLVKNTPEVTKIQSALSELSGDFPCEECGTLPIFTKHNAARAVLSDSLRCNSCRKVTGFPFSWLF